MGWLANLLLALAVLVSALAQALTDPRVTRKFVYHSMIAFAVYAVHVTTGILVMLYLLPFKPEAAVGATMALLGWIGLGGLGLVRFAPRLREPPRFLLRFGVVDAICLLLIASGVILARIEAGAS